MPGPAPYRFRFKAMGCPCALQIHAASPRDARALAAVARGEIARLERKYSRYRHDSLTARINASAGSPGGVAVDAETDALLDHAETLYRQSDGRFDPTSGILRRAWDFRSGRLPEPGAIEALLPRLGWRKLVRAPRRLTLPLEGMELDFGGFVKEYAADRAAALLVRAGCRSALVDLGGDLAVPGPQPGGRPWSVGIRDARAPERALRRVELFRGGIATSGDYERAITVGGKRYGHILDPHTGWPIEGIASATALAERCLIAGSATTLALLRGAEAPDWLAQLGLPHLCQHRDGRVQGTLEGNPGGGPETRLSAPESRRRRARPRRPAARGARPGSEPRRAAPRPRR